MNVTIIGAGLAGSTAAALLKDRHNVRVFERNAKPAGMLDDTLGIQWYGPRAFHTDDEAVWRFITQFADFKPFDLRVHSDINGRLIELPLRPESGVTKDESESIFRIYSEKAWGRPFNQLPDFIKTRVPSVCTDGRTGYHAGRFKGQPVGGYTRMIHRMLDGVQVEYKSTTDANQLDGAVIFTGNISDYAGVAFPWVGRRWLYDHEHGGHDSGVHIINHATRLVPQLRTYDLQQINPHHAGRGVAMEFAGKSGTPCYPSTDPAYRILADQIIEQAKERGHWLCGRMGTYQYLDMDKTIRNVMDTIAEAGL